MLQKFWEIEAGGIENVPLSDERSALDTAEESITYNNKCYRIAIPWKENFTNLPNNMEMAEKRLQNLERRLSRQPEVTKEYAKIIEGHLEKGYITKLPPVEDEESTVKWYLSHFLVI